MDDVTSGFNRRRPRRSSSLRTNRRAGRSGARARDWCLRRSAHVGNQSSNSVRRHRRRRRRRPPARPPAISTRTSPSTVSTAAFSRRDSRPRSPQRGHGPVAVLSFPYAATRSGAVSSATDRSRRPSSAAGAVPTSEHAGSAATNLAIVASSSRRTSPRASSRLRFRPTRRQFSRHGRASLPLAVCEIPRVPRPALASKPRPKPPAERPVIAPRD